MGESWWSKVSVVPKLEAICLLYPSQADSTPKKEWQSDLLFQWSLIFLLSMLSSESRTRVALDYLQWRVSLDHDIIGLLPLIALFSLSKKLFKHALSRFPSHVYCTSLAVLLSWPHYKVCLTLSLSPRCSAFVWMRGLNFRLRQGFGFSHL